MTRLADRATLDWLLQQAVSSGILPGVVALVATTEDILYEAAFGVRDVGSGAAMSLDTIFGIASMTKTLTATAVLQLAERGLLRLDQPVRDILPAFGDLPVLSGFTGDTPLLRRPVRQATVHDLLANVSGLAYDTWNEDLWRYHAVTGIPNISGGTRKTFRVPLTDDPGVRFSYGTGSDWAGLIIEEISGQGLDAYFRGHITGPLNMHDTDVRLTVAQRARTAAVHRRSGEDGWIAQPHDEPAIPEFYAGGHCLYSTAPDYLRFQRALLCGGIGDSRILEPESVRSMLTNQIGTLAVQPARTCNRELSEDLDFAAGSKWGFGLMLDGGCVPGMRPIGSGGWAGVFNTLYWLDRDTGIAAALYTQTLPFRDQAIMRIYAEFERRLYRELTL
ncbi:MAG TPA: serine hydrolase domain-containing protein [Trebonia sp.]|jgi:CubicO group peptidase (beta-lactamase class C family)|nr:serine hydrolase domain-containing protein [Trebonia sp.]